MNAWSVFPLPMVFAGSDGTIAKAAEIEELSSFVSCF
jgi:hypothetical protein